MINIASSQRKIRQQVAAENLYNNIIIIPGDPFTRKSHSLFQYRYNCGFENIFFT